MEMYSRKIISYTDTKLINPLSFLGPPCCGQRPGEGPEESRLPNISNISNIFEHFRTFSKTEQESEFYDSIFGCSYSSVDDYIFG